MSQSKTTSRVPAALATISITAMSSTAAAQMDNAGDLVKLFRPSGLVVAALAVAVAIFVIRIVNSLTTRLSARFTERRLLAQQTNTVLRFVVYVITIVLVVSSTFQLEKEAVLALSGVLVVATGFALKDLASSVVAGITILFDRPFQVGDRVTVAGFYGEIQSIGLRSVRMVTLDDSTVTIPNNRFLNEVVVSGNSGALDMQIVMDFFVAPDSDIDVARRVVYEALRTSRFVYLQKPVVVLVKDVIEANYFATRLRGKAYVLDVHYEKEFETDVTVRVKRAFEAKRVRPPQVLLAGVPAAAESDQTAL